MTILDEIVDYKRSEELPRRKQHVSLEVVRDRAAESPPPRDFVASLRRGSNVAVIAELKKASPSKGILCPDFDPRGLLEIYVENGASAISVLTDEKYFQGHLGYLEQVSRFRETGRGDFGILRKDFVIDPYQVYEARSSGADALLLIVAALNDAEIDDLLSLTRQLGMEALVEVHNRAELERALVFRPQLIGVNNRDLRDFSVDLNTCLSLRPSVPDDICFVAESGIHRREDVDRLGRAGVDAILVGESLITAYDPGAQVRLLSSTRRKEVAL